MDRKGTAAVTIIGNDGPDSDKYSDVALVDGEITAYRVSTIRGKVKEKREYFMEWREDFDDQWGWFTKTDLLKEIKRIKALEEDDDGEASVGKIIKGKDVSDEFGV